MSDLAVHTTGLGKSYLLRHDPVSRNTTLREDLLGLPKRLFRRRSAGEEASREEMWALRDVNLTVRQGEVLGIIGRNGSGKSTLLKILSRVTEPTLGRAELHGRVGSLLEVGTGFHAELTGRENIFLSGAVLGMRHDEIRRRFDEIVDFSEVERFLDTPVKHYSSGMYTRLAFAVAAHLNPEILLVDEVLAVGDAQFQRKCLGMMEGIARAGRTVFLVSHNTTVVANLCTRAILLRKGALVADGNAASVVATYLSEGGQDDRAQLDQRRDRTGDGRLRFVRLEILSEGEQPETGRPIRFRIHYQVSPEVSSLREVHLNFSINNLGGAHLLLFTTRDMRPAPPEVREDGWVECLIPFLPLTAGSYGVNLYAATSGVVLDYVVNAATLTVDDSGFYPPGVSRLDNHPPVVVHHEWSTKE